jgi:hypothetical protein
MKVKKAAAPPSKENYEFIPARNWLGKDHKEKGVYINDSEVIFYKCEGYKGQSVKFDVPAVASMAHITKFKFLFLVLFYSFEFIHSIAFINKEGQLLGTLAIRSFSRDNLRKILQTLLKHNQNVSMDEAVTQLVEENKTGKLTWNFIKAILKGMLIWGILAFVLMVLFIIAVE